MSLWLHQTGRFQRPHSQTLRYLHGSLWWISDYCRTSSVCWNMDLRRKKNTTLITKTCEQPQKFSPGKKKTDKSVCHIHLLFCHRKPHKLVSPSCSETSTQLWHLHQSRRNTCRRDQSLKSQNPTAVVTLILHHFTSINVTCIGKFVFSQKRNNKKQERL